jgi:hypothetical protein
VHRHNDTNPNFGNLLPGHCRPAGIGWSVPIRLTQTPTTS